MSAGDTMGVTRPDMGPHLRRVIGFGRRQNIRRLSFFEGFSIILTEAGLGSPRTVLLPMLRVIKRLTS